MPSDKKMSEPDEGCKLNSEADKLVCEGNGECVDHHCDCNFPYSGPLCGVLSPEAIVLFFAVGLMFALLFYAVYWSHRKGRLRRTLIVNPSLQQGMLEGGSGGGAGYYGRPMMDLPAAHGSMLGASNMRSHSRVATTHGMELPTSALIDEADIRIGRELGRGMFSTVHVGTYRGGEVAVKSIALKVGRRGNGSFASIGAIEEAGLGSVFSKLSIDLEKEAELMASLRHPNIVTFMGLCVSHESGRLRIVTEFCSRGSLMDVNQDRRLKMTWEQRHHLACGAAAGIVYLHASKPRAIIHRDLKSPNVLVTSSFDAKIADFGMTREGKGATTLESTLHKAAQTIASGTPSGSPVASPTRGARPSGGQAAGSAAAAEDSPSLSFLSPTDSPPGELDHAPRTDELRDSFAANPLMTAEVRAPPRPATRCARPPPAHATHPSFPPSHTLAGRYALLVRSRAAAWNDVREDARSVHGESRCVRFWRRAVGDLHADGAVGGQENHPRGVRVSGYPRSEARGASWPRSQWLSPHPAADHAAVLGRRPQKAAKHGNDSQHAQLRRLPPGVARL